MEALLTGRGLERASFGAVWSSRPGNGLVTINGGVYNFDYISVVRVQWPTAAWYAPAGMRSRPGNGAWACAVARVNDLAVALVSAMNIEPREP